MARIIGLELDLVLADPIQPAVESALTVYRGRRPELYPVPGKALVVLGLVKRPLDPGRRNLQNISRWDNVLDVDDGLDLLAQVLAITMRNATGLINVYSEQQTARGPDQVPVDQL